MSTRETRKISELKNWDKNPRGIKKDDFERLKKQIQKLGQYKPLLITEDGTVLGGNMRLKAYKELGIENKLKQARIETAEKFDRLIPRTSDDQNNLGWNECLNEVRKIADQ